MTGSVVRAGRHYLRTGNRSILPVGAHFVPSEGPDWPWRVDESVFDRGFAQMSAIGMTAVRIDLLWSAIEPEPGRYDEDHLRRLDAILEIAKVHDLWLHPTLFVGGEVGDAFWDVPWRGGRHPAPGPGDAAPAARPCGDARTAMEGRPGDHRVGSHRRAAVLVVPRHDGRRRPGMDPSARRCAPRRGSGTPAHDRDVGAGGGVGPVPGGRRR